MEQEKQFATQEPLSAEAEKNLPPICRDGRVHISRVAETPPEGQYERLHQDWLRLQADMKQQKK